MTILLYLINYTQSELKPENFSGFLVIIYVYVCMHVSIWPSIVLLIFCAQLSKFRSQRHQMDCKQYKNKRIPRANITTIWRGNVSKSTVAIINILHTALSFMELLKIINILVWFVYHCLSPNSHRMHCLWPISCLK